MYLTSVKEGSTILSGYVAALTNTSANKSYSILKNSGLIGFNVSNYSLTYNNQTLQCEKSSCRDFQDSSQGAIIGIIIGLLGGAILVVLAVYCVCKCY